MKDNAAVGERVRGPLLAETPAHPRRLRPRDCFLRPQLGAPRGLHPAQRPADSGD